MAGPARGPYLKAQQTRRQLLDAGREILIERGASTGLDRVTLKEAIDRTGVPRSTAYELFQESDLSIGDAFRQAILSELDTHINLEPTMEAVAEVLDASAAVLDEGDPMALASVLREVIRRGVHANVHAVTADLGWAMHVASMATSTVAIGQDNEVISMQREVAEANGARLMELYSRLAAAFGLRLRSPVTWDQFTATVVGGSDGVAVRSLHDSRLASVKRPTGPHGELQPWHAAAVLFEGTVLTMLEADPDATASADLSAWLG